MPKEGFVTSITHQSEDFPGWYNDVVLKAELADYSPVRGCMIIRPYGYAIWESMQAELDRYIKATGHSNVYFPLFVPKSLLEKEAEHVEGFNPQVAWVTHAGGKAARRVAGHPPHQRGDHRRQREGLDPVLSRPAAADEHLEQRRPLGTADAALPAHDRIPLAGGAHLPRHRAGSRRTRSRPVSKATDQVSEDWLAIPVIKGRKTDSEKFPGADCTWCIEAMMRDKKALQAGTSHMLGQNFARAAGIEFLDRDNVRKNPYGTSWGFSTRMVGATIMTHGDDSGLVLPPNVAPVQVVIVPIFRKDEEKAAVAEAIDRFQAALAATPEGKAVRVKVDWRDDSPGFKYNHWELARRAVPARDRAARRGRRPGHAGQARRPVEGSRAARPAGAELPARLRAYQAELFQRARDFRGANTHKRRHIPGAQGRTGRRRAGSSWRPGAAAANARSR